MKWYLVIYEGEEENEYFKADDDGHAMYCLRDDLANVVEVHACNDDECLTPARLIYH